MSNLVERSEEKKAAMSDEEKDKKATEPEKANEPGKNAAADAVPVAKKSGGSLVERAAVLSSSSGFARAIGTPNAAADGKRRDPSSLNPDSNEAAQPASFRGIGAPGAGRTRPVEKDEATTEATSPFSAITAPVKKTSALERMADTAEAAKPLVQKKERKLRPPQEVDLVALREAGYITPDMPANLMSEEFRIIKRSLLLHAFSKGRARSKNSNVMLVSSSNPSEGKTFCTINLALSIATEQDITVLLIDADFSKPEILNRLGLNGGRGLMDIVADDSLDVGDCLIRTNIPNLVLLPAGRQHNLTTELLASERMETIVNEIATRYPDRLVIFDSPPVLASSAASVLALYMGQIVFVIEAEKTTEPQIKESLNMISSCEHINLLLNKTRYNSSNQKFASYYGYGGR